MRSLLLLGIALTMTLGGCADRPDHDARANLGSLRRQLAELDVDRIVCARRIGEARAEPSLPGALTAPVARAATVGRAAGHPVIFLRPPPPLKVAPEHEDVRLRIHRVVRRHARPGRRDRLLRGGYLFADDPVDAFHLVDRLSLPDLFSEPEVWLQRGETMHRLERVPSHEPPGFAYRHAEGPLEGERAVILFADRVATERSALTDPWHRDVEALRERVGFDRMRVVHITNRRIVAELRFGDVWLEALIDADRDAHLTLSCLAAPRSQREAAERWVEARAPRRRSMAALRGAIDAIVSEQLPFDRPRDADDHWTDGKLRPAWEKAYRRGRLGFGRGEEGYAVYDRDGRPHPPQTCVAMVLDAYERASGTWYRPRGQEPGRVIGGLDFDAYGIDNRSGVLGFEDFAKRQPQLFVHRRIPDDERIPFRDRERFLGYLFDHADDFLPGDIVAIRGLKRDGNIHQHAILIEDLDPLTGVASGLVDQMTRPRRRTWEDIMAEAPARSLFYHLRPTSELLGRLTPSDGD